MNKEAFRLYPTFVQDREIFRRGFEYADNNPNHEAFNTRLKLEKEEWLDKAREWLRHNWRERVWTNRDDVIFAHWEKDFKKYMEDK